MILVPKFHKTSSALDTHVRGNLEIQMLNHNILEELDELSITIRKIKLEKLILHLPLSLIDLEFAMLIPEISERLKEFFSRYCKLATELNFEPYAVMHTSLHDRYTYVIPNMVTFLENVLDAEGNENLTILLENSLPNLSSSTKNYFPLNTVLEQIEHPRVRVCFDLCHYQAWGNLLNDKVVISEKVKERIKSVHFSETYDSDGWRNPKTHGRKHKSDRQCVIDLLEVAGIASNLEELMLVTEICEEDYDHNPDTIEEVERLARLSEYDMAVKSLNLVY